MVNNSEEKDFVPLQETTRSLLLAMKVFGLFHDPSVASRIQPEHCLRTHRSGIQQTAFTYISTAYSGIITLVLLLNLLRYIPAFFVGHDFTSELTVFRVIVIGWYFNCFLNIAIIFYACYRKDRLNKFFEYYNKISTDEIARKLKIQTNCARFRRNVCLGTIIAIVLVLFNTVGSLYMVFSDLENGSAIVMTNPLPVHYSSLALVAILSLYCSAAWILPVVFVITFASVLRHQLGTVTKSIKDLMDTKEKCVIRRLNDFRLKHLHYTKAIDLLDRDFQYLFAALYITALWMCCFILYQLVNTKDLPTFSMIMYGAWLTSNIVIVLALSISAAHVNDQVRYDFG